MTFVWGAVPLKDVSNGKANLKTPTNAGSPDEDSELIARCRAELPDETAAYYELLQKYEGMVYNTCYRMLGSPQEAEEACQDAFLQVFRKLHQFEGRSTFKTWLFRIVYNFCMTRRKKLAMKREREQVVGEKIVKDADESFQVAMGPENESPEKVQRALSMMSEDEKEVMTLRFISDLSLDEMADVMGLKLSATKMRLYRAMEQFKKVYSGMEVA